MQVKNLSPNEHNPRKIQDHRLKMLKKAMARFGDLSGVVFNQKTKNLVGGHQRTKIFNASTPVTVLKKYSKPTKTGTVAEGFIELDNERFAYREVYWDANLEKAANIAANKQAGEWDQDLLATWMKDLSAFDLDFDLDLTMFDEEELKQFDGITVKEHTRKSATGVDEDEVPEKVPAKTKLGDIYQLGMHRLMCGDSTNKDNFKILMKNEKADIVFTSPPYNIGKSIRGNMYENDKDNKSDEDYVNFISAVTTNCLSFSDFLFINLQLLESNKRALINYQFRFIDKIKDILIWNKSRYPPHINKGTFGCKWEYVFAISNDGKSRSFPCNWQGKYSNVIETENNSINEHAEIHRAGFPVSFPEGMIEKMDFTNSILDPFGGTGTTMIAAEKTNRKCFMMEIDPHYCDVIVARWEKYTGDKAKLINRPDVKLKKKPV